MFSKRLSFRRKSAQDNSSLAPSSKAHEDDGDSSRPSSRRHSQPHREQLDLNPLGLNVIYTPQNGHKADIVFVHGLGGTSRWTWSKNHDPDLFWPLTFLPLEPDLCLARILTFGYNAKFQQRGNASTTVLDFAKNLLYDLKYTIDHEAGNLNIGTVPLLFVVHSMGGLIVKEAYMQGQNDPDYENIVKAISAIIFLATPHRGTNLADILNRVLEATWLTNSKFYISELSSDSFTLQKLNEQFRHVAPRLDIVSFYETQPTSIKGARVMILEKDSSVLGYPGEISKALDADHHGVCKYGDRRDPNYITVRNALKSIVSKIISTNRPKDKAVGVEIKSSDLRSALDLPQLPDSDYIFFQDQWTAGTNGWLLEEEAFAQWLAPRQSTASILFVHGGAASGKSVLASFVIDHLVKREVNCQYFFIRVADRKKRTLSLMLRSIAYQAAQNIPEFALRISELANEGIEFGAADARTIWERLFKSVLFKLDADPLYWVIDGLDEADDVRATIRLFSDLEYSSTPIRVLLLGRPTSEITTALTRIPSSIDQGAIRIDGHVEDFYAHIDRDLCIGGGADFRQDIVERIVAGAQNSFLWVRLAVEKVNTCHTITDVSNALEEFPPGMEALYDRMARSIANDPSLSARNLAQKVLQCLACSFRILTVGELSQALNEDFSGILDFEQSIVGICGGFVVLDNSGHIGIIHHSAREYLLGEEGRPISIDRHEAHEHMFLSCMNCLMAPGLRGKLRRNPKPEFLDYSASSWSSHLALAPATSPSVAKAVKQFLTGNWVLTWIHVLVLTKHLRILVRASKHLSKYAAARHDMQATNTNQLVEHQLLESWVVDFVKILGKFGTNLRLNPEAIYKSIPPFCPTNSAIFHQFGKSESSSLTVSGLSNPDWDDSIARLSFNSYASSILAAGKVVAVSCSSGDIFLHYAQDFEELHTNPIRHRERVYRAALNSGGTQLVTYGYKTTKQWEISSGRCLLTVENIESRPRPLVILFSDNGNTLLVGFEDRRIRSLALRDPAPTWQLVAELEEPELDGHYLNSSNCMALNSDGSLVAVAYRGHPLSAWEVDGPEHINHCWRAREEVARGEILEVIWLPHSPEILGLYIEGIVFKWNPYEGGPEEMQVNASRLAMSRDGHLFATGDVQGTVKVYTTSEFQLLFQLASQDPVLGLAFGPSIYRFYDVRGLYGNAWEPNALMRYAERLNKAPDGDTDSSSLSIASATSATVVRRVDAITAIATSPLGRLYCFGTECGAVVLYDLERGRLGDLHASRGFLGIEQLAWSPDGRYICFSDSSKNVLVKSIIGQGSGSDFSAAETVFEMSMNNRITGPIVQLLFSDTGNLLVSSPSMACTISLGQGEVTNRLEWQSDGRKWMLHPLDGTLVTLEPTSISVWDWALTELGSCQVSLPLEEEPPSPTSEVPANQARTIDRVFTTHDKRHIVAHISLGIGIKAKKYVYSFTTDFLVSYRKSSPETTTHASKMAPILDPALLPEETTSHIATILSFLSHDRMIFLSKEFSICSWKVPFSQLHAASRHPFLGPSSWSSSSKATSNRVNNGSYDLNSQVGHKSAFESLFTLPGDWIGKECLTLSTIWKKERSLLCPRNGEIAVVTTPGLG